MATEKATGRDSDKIMLRVPDGMRDRIKAAADANNRTMNAEIVARLQASFDQPSASMTVTHTSDTTLSTILAELERLFDEKLGHQQKAYIDSAEGGRMQDVKIVKKPKA